MFRGIDPVPSKFFFFFNDTATTEIYTLSLHDALPISLRQHCSAAGQLRTTKLYMLILEVGFVNPPEV